MTLLTPALVSFSRRLTDRERKRKILKDEKKHHSTVDESSSEQQFRKLHMQLPLLCEKSGAILLVLVGLTVAWSDEIREDLEFSTDCIVRNFTAFYEGTVLL